MGILRAAQQAALDRERAEQHRLATHLHDLLTSGQPLAAPGQDARAGTSSARKETR